ncbi:MAG: hypothetical protein Q9167_005904 [Letrouitia subvulpina]
MSPTQQTLRVTGLPPATHQNDIRRHFEVHVTQRGRQIIEAIGPICKEPGRNTNQTTVTFSSYEIAQQALSLDYEKRQLIAVGGGAATFSLDQEFRGMTTLQSLANPKTNKPDIEWPYSIVALHGLTGHAWNTFTASEAFNKEADRVRENNWLQENLPRLLQQHQEQNIYARVMSFGYDADIWVHDRPLFFIGHSLGGIVIKEAIVKMANEALTNSLDPSSTSQGKYIFPVKGCLFFGVPHKGASIAKVATAFLKWFSKAFNINNHNVRDLEPKSERLARVSSEFATTQSNLEIPVMSFYETLALNHTVGLIVTRDSAIYDYPMKPEPFGVEKNHKDMVKFLNDNDHALKPAIYFLTELAKQAIKLQIARNRSIRLPPKPRDNNGNKVEDRLNILSNYDTVFLIDDSPSMAGYKWELVKNILDYCTPLATRYDRNGIDIHFFNNKGEDNVRQPEIAAQIHHDVVLKGSTPLLDRLSVHLKQYFQKYKKSEWAADFKRYNLIILTDGEPDDEWDEDGDPNDQTKPAFRLIQKKIVTYARKLDDDDVEAEPGQVGIQFCQIGNDEDATKFFQFLDDRLKGKEKLGRDMVDTIQCQSEVDLTEDWFRKLLLGAIDKREDNRKIEDQQIADDAANAVLPDRSISSRTSHSRPFSEVDTLVGPSRGYSFPIDTNSTTLHESPIVEKSNLHHPFSQRANETASMTTTTGTKQKASPPPRSSTIESIKKLGRPR